MAAFGIFPARRAIAAARPCANWTDRSCSDPSTSNTLINDIKVPPVLFVDAHIEVVYHVFK